MTEVKCAHFSAAWEKNTEIRVKKKKNCKLQLTKEILGLKQPD